MIVSNRAVILVSLIILMITAIYIFVPNSSEDVSPAVSADPENIDDIYETNKVIAEAGIKPSVIGPATQKDKEGTTSSLRPCTASDVEGSSSVMHLGSSVIGTISLKARSSVECSIEGFPYVAISDSRGALGVSMSTVGSARVVTLSEGEIARLRTTWGNWCGRSTDAISYRLTLPGDSGYLLIPAIATNGAVQGTPTCTAAQGRSMLAVEPFIK